MNDPTAVPRETTMRLAVEQALAAHEGCPECFEQTNANLQAIGFVLSELEEEWLEVAFAERFSARDKA